MVKLPYMMKVGRKKVYVTLRARNGRRVTGCYSPLVGALTVYTGHELRPRSDAAVRLTFFHELTHAVLYEMGDPLARDEHFVTEFARLLSGAIETAKFEDDEPAPAQAFKLTGATKVKGGVFFRQQDDPLPRNGVLYSDGKGMMWLKKKK